MSTIKIWLSLELRVEDITTITLAQYSTAELVVLFAAMPATGPTFNWITPGGVKIEQRALFRDGELDEGGYFAYKATIYPFFTIGIGASVDIGYSRISIYEDTMFSPMVKVPINKTILPDQLDLPTSNHEEILNQLIPGTYNETYKTYTIPMGISGVNMEMGQEVYILGKANGLIPDGALVFIEDSPGSAPIPLIGLANKDGINGSSLVIGMATHTIQNGSVGFITIIGRVNGLNTSAYVEGTTLYLGNSGGWTNIRPEAPSRVVQIGYVVRQHSSEGAILINLRCFPKLEELSGVSIIDVAANDFIKRDITNTKYENYSLFPRWNDLVFPLTLSRRNPTTLKPDYDTINMGLLFIDNNETEYVDFIIQMPHYWIEGSTIYPHIHVIHDQVAVPTFRLQYKWYNIGETVPTSWNNYDLNSYAITTSFIDPRSNIVKGDSGINGVDKTISSILKIRLYRVAGDAYQGTILADQFDIHIEVDGFGSELQYHKY